MSATSPIKLNQFDLKLTARSIEIRQPLFGDVVEYSQALNDIYEISRWIADPKYDQYREQMRRHISDRYEESINEDINTRLKAFKESIDRVELEEEKVRMEGMLREFWEDSASDVSVTLRDKMEGDNVDLSLVDEHYLKSLMRLNVEDRLRTTKISLNSPLEIMTIVAAVPAVITTVWGLVQILDKLANLKKVKLEIQKLEKELAKPSLTSAAEESNEKERNDDVNSFMERLHKATPYERMLFKRHTERVYELTLRIREIDIEIIETK